MPSRFDDELDPEEQAYDDFLAAAERGAAPEVDAFLRDRGLADHDDLRERLVGLGRAASATGQRARGQELPPTDIGPYTIEERLGSGGFGVVYLAHQSEPVERRVALKVLRPGMDSEEVLARFRAEQSALLRMDHPGIARVLDAGSTDEGRPFFAMEYVPGEPITRFCDAARMSVAERVALFAAVCDAVQHAHQKGVVHRDLKPSNVLVRRVDGQPAPKVIDFGVAKALEEPLEAKSLRTQDGAMVGTLEYMSPEQASGAFAGGEIDTRADIYSLGVVLYELLSGSLPIDPRSSARESGTDVVRAVLEVTPPSLVRRASESTAASRRSSRTELDRTLRGDLDWVVLRSLEKDPARRYASASELAAELRRYLADEPVLAGPPSLAYRLTKLARKHRLAALASGAAVLAIILGVVGVTFALLEAQDERDRARAAEDLAGERLVEANTARDSAEAERAESLAVTRFLRSMWSFARPTGAEAGPVPAVHLLDEASKTLDAAMADEAGLRTTLRSTLGEINLDLERLDEAEREMRAALELGRGEGDASDVELATLEFNLGVVLAERAQWKEARALAESALETRERVLGPDHVEVAAVLGLQARALAFEGEHAEAVELARRAWRIAALAFGRPALETSSYAANLATFLTTAGELDEARDRLEEACEVRARELGEDHPDTLASLSALAILWHRQGRHGEAATTFERIHAARQRMFGPEHLSTARAANNAATQYVLQEDRERALPLLRQAVEVFDAQLLEGHPTRLSTATNLAKVLVDSGRSSAALPVIQDVVRQADSALPEGHLLRGTPRTVLGEALLAVDRADEAREAFEAAIPILAARRGEGHATTVRAMRNLSSCCEKLGLLDAARTWASRAEEAAKDRDG